MYEGFSYLNSSFYLVKCYTYSVVTEDMIYLNIYYKSFSLTKNVKVEFSDDLYSSICVMCQVTHLPLKKGTLNYINCNFDVPKFQMS